MELKMPNNFGWYNFYELIAKIQIAQKYENQDKGCLIIERAVFQEKCFWIV